MNSFLLGKVDKNVISTDVFIVCDVSTELAVQYGPTRLALLRICA